VVHFLSGFGVGRFLRETNQTYRSYCFGVFEVDSRAGELRKRGHRIRLQDQPFQVLLMLLDHPNQVVTREEFQKSLWGADTFVDFDHGLNKAINKIREALGDTPQNPCFIETVARRGYRFVAPVREVARTAHPSGRTMLAVLPFKELSGDAEQEYFAEGLTEEMITQLGRLHPRGLGVIARTSSMRYKQAGKKIGEIGTELGVDYLLQGSVRRAADRIRITAQLVQVSDGTQIWAESYERGLADIFAIQRNVAESVARSLALELFPTSERTLGSAIIADPAALEAYLRGRYHWHRLSEDGLQKSVAYFQLAIEKDPKFALAYSALAEVQILVAFIGLLPSSDVIPQARQVTLKALAINEDLAEAHASLASINKNFDWEWLAAEKEYKRSIELNPNNANARWGFADLLSALGRAEEAMDQIQRAKELDPFSLVINVQISWTLYMAREYARSKEQSMKTIEMEPEFAAAHYSLGLALEQTGKMNEAILAFEKARDGSAGNSIGIAGLGHAYSRGGRDTDARGILEGLKRASAVRYVSPYAFAIVHAGLGENDLTIGYLEKAFELHDVWLVWLRRDPRFDGLHQDAHFQNLLARMNFPA
jgi:TolB-like protein/Flp pilus assembly protein TadD